MTIGEFTRRLDFTSERAAREYINKYGVPHVREGQKILVVNQSLLDWCKEREIHPLSKAQLKAEVDEDLRRIAPTARQRRSKQRLPLIHPKKGT